MSKLKINFIELGFRFLNRNKSRGETAYTEEKFINQLRIPKNLNIGVMINAGDFEPRRLDGCCMQQNFS